MRENGGGRGFMNENGWGGGVKKVKRRKRGKKRNLRENRWLN